MKKGFSLIELIIAIVVLGILFSLTIPSFQSMLQKARFQSEAEAIVNLLFNTRNNTLSGMVCEQNGQPKSFLFSYKKNKSQQIQFGCNEQELFSLQESKIVLQENENDLKVYFQENPYQMIIEQGKPVQQASFEIQSIQNPLDIWTVCLDSEKGFPEIYTRHCACFSEGKSISLCNSLEDEN